MEPNDHAGRVDRWLRKAANGLTDEQRLPLFEQAVAALWRRAHVILGEVTVAAVTERVLYYAAEKHPVLAPLRVESDGVAHFDNLERTVKSKKDELTPAFRFVLIEFLTILGNLTDEIVTPALHSELSKVTLSRAAKREEGDA